MVKRKREESDYYFREKQILKIIDSNSRYVDRYQVIRRVPVVDSEVYFCNDLLNDNKEVVLKAEGFGYKASKLMKEWKLYQKLKQCKDFDIILNQFFGIDHKFLIMKKRGIDLRRHYIQLKNNNMWNNDSHLGSYAVQMIEGLEKCHDLGVIHLDPKPNNYVLDESDENKIYLIDFDSAKEYIDCNDNHIQYKSKVDSTSISGNRIYISINGHNCEQQSRRDDIIFLGFSLIWMSRRGLPWTRKSCADFKSREEYHNYIKTQKEEHCSTDEALEQLCHRCPKLAQYMRYCLNLKFEEKPNYEFLKSLFQ